MLKDYLNLAEAYSAIERDDLHSRTQLIEAHWELLHSLDLASKFELIYAYSMDLIELQRYMNYMEIVDSVLSLGIGLPPEQSDFHWRSQVSNLIKGKAMCAIHLMAYQGALSHLQEAAAIQRSSHGLETLYLIAQIKKTRRWHHVNQQVALALILSAAISFGLYGLVVLQYFSDYSDTAGRVSWTLLVLAITLYVGGEAAKWFEAQTRTRRFARKY